MKKSPDYHKIFLHGEKRPLRKKSVLRNIFKKWGAYAKIKKRNKIIFLFFLKYFFYMDERKIWF